MPTTVELTTPSLPAISRLEIMLDGHKRQVESGRTVLATLRGMGRASSTDFLYCQDGSCRRCLVTIDGVKQLGCQTQVRAGMALEQKRESLPANPPVCPCLGLQTSDLESAFRTQGTRPLSVQINALRLGEGRCRGRLCVPVFRRMAEARGHPEASQWIDWRFPSEEWVLNPGSG